MRKKWQKMAKNGKKSIKNDKKQKNTYIAILGFFSIIY